MTPPDSRKPVRRRVRYQGTHPRRFEDKYKELDPERDPETIAKVIASGKTPAGQHRPILVAEILAILVPQPGERGADVTLGYGGHSEALLEKLRPGGRLLALDVDSEQLPRTEARLRGRGHDEEALIVRQSNYAGLASILTQIGWQDGVDFLLADLGLSSMQIDNPARGFSYKHDGPLDMRMNPDAGLPARYWIENCKVEKLARVLAEGSNEPLAEQLAEAIRAATTRAPLKTTRQLRSVIEAALPGKMNDTNRKATVARVFQAIRIAVNKEFSALDRFLSLLPSCLRPGARVAVLCFHSGEDRRVKHHFRDGFRSGVYREIAPQVVRPSYREIGGNSRAAAAKMRWAIKG
ncbi:MAG: 16S rRNA (cytosine(1402)-N(4))-methyltransferase RsmH [Acidobacteria bacterium]|nr:MAG: 16S rRNA (cytosine(1402)-N(4))-methyltransferase RsmH [Acidobacteriota bacterium]